MHSIVEIDRIKLKLTLAQKFKSRINFTIKSSIINKKLREINLDLEKLSEF